jgi:hypothetical protein
VDKKSPGLEKGESCGGVERLEEEGEVAGLASDNNIVGVDLKLKEKMEGRKRRGDYEEEQRRGLRGCCCCYSSQEASFPWILK